MSIWLEGERLHVLERLVISPSVGIFEPSHAVGFVGRIEEGTSVGTIGDVEVCSPFAGTLMGILALSGERVRPGQPVAWLRTDET